MLCADFYVQSGQLFKAREVAVKLRKLNRGNPEYEKLIQQPGL